MTLPPTAPAVGRSGIGAAGLRLTAFAVLVIGLLLRTALPLLRPDAPLASCDGRAYHVLAVSLARGQGMTINDSPLAALCNSNLLQGPSHHFPPGLPLFESVFVLAFGDTALALLVPLLLLSWGAVVVAWWTTSNLYGRQAGLLVAAAISVEWTGIYYGTWLGYAENLVLIMFMLAIWAVLRALKDDRYMLLGGLFAGLGYLAKAGIGWFFLFAGLGGVMWRLLFRGPRALLNRWYLGALALFAVPVALWSARNLALFWDGSPLGLLDAWQTSAYSAYLLGLAVQHPDQFLLGVVGKLPVLVLFLGLPLLPLLPMLRSALRRWREEEAFGLWMTAGLIFALGWFFAAAFWVGERTSFVWADHLRYVAPAFIPLYWLVLRDRDAPRTTSWALSLLTGAGLSLAMFALLIVRSNPFVAPV